MPLIILGVIFIAAGAASIAGQDKHKSYDSDTTRQMLKDMTGKSKSECRRIIKRYGKK